jgi:hypothetical protein
MNTRSLKREWWRPEEHKIWVRRLPTFGWGCTINFAESLRGE